jgi:pimeloyl-ACP methyl ester carboxylesterase
MKIILVHGGWQGGWAWDAVAEHLRAAGHEVFAPTLRGLEDGDVDRAGITITDMTDDLVRQIDQRSRFWWLRNIPRSANGHRPRAQVHRNLPDVGCSRGRW